MGTWLNKWDDQRQQHRKRGLSATQGAHHVGSLTSGETQTNVVKRTQAKPAEGMMASRAAHVLAAFVLVNDDRALRAFLCVHRL